MKNAFFVFLIYETDIYNFAHLKNETPFLFGFIIKFGLCPKTMEWPGTF
jgi:hypothetical protein